MKVAKPEPDLTADFIAERLISQLKDEIASRHISIQELAKTLNITRQAMHYKLTKKTLSIMDVAIIVQKHNINCELSFYDKEYEISIEKLFDLLRKRIRLLEKENKVLTEYVNPQK